MRGDEMPLEQLYLWKLFNGDFVMKIKNLKHLLEICVAIALVACGGGGGSPGTVSGVAPKASEPILSAPVGTNNVVVTRNNNDQLPAEISLTSSNASLSSAAPSALITARVSNDGNVPLPNIHINFNAPAGTLSGGSDTTDANGNATITLTTGSDKSTRNILVTATAGAANGGITIKVVGP